MIRLATSQADEGAFGDSDHSVQHRCNLVNLKSRITIESRLLWLEKGLLFGLRHLDHLIEHELRRDPAHDL
jgi:hypothetical protein